MVVKKRGEKSEMIIHMDKTDIKSLLGFMGRVNLTGAEAPTFMRIVNAIGVAEDEDLGVQTSELLVETPQPVVTRSTVAPSQPAKPKKDWRDGMSR